MAAEPARHYPDRDPELGPDLGPELERRPREVPPPTPEGARPPGRGYTIGSFVLAGIALFVLPVVAAAIGLGVGWMAYRQGDPAARWAMVANAVILVLAVIAAIIYAT